MTDEDRLLAAIVEAPADDAPRLVYADWLQAKGDPRGEFIQLQCQLAAAPDDERRRAIKIAENKLFAAHGESWLAPLREALPVNAFFKVAFVRGFPEEAQLSVDCASHWPAVWNVAPLLRCLRLLPRFHYEVPMKRPSLDGVLDAPQLGRLHTLELHLAGAGNAAAKVVARASNLSNLSRLDLRLSVWGETAAMFERADDGDLALDDAGIAELARSPFLANVDTLLLEGNRITSQGVAAIAHGPWRLRTLELGTNLVEPETLARSLQGPALEQLEVLGLSGTAFDPKSVGALVSAPVLAKLRELDLERCHLGVAGIEALCNKLALPALRSLRLERNSLCDKGAFAMAECAAFATLTNLEAGHNRMGHKAAVALSSSANLANLERLTLNEPRWKPETAELFAESPTLAKAKIYLRGRLMARKKSKKSATEEQSAKSGAAEAEATAAKAKPVKAKPVKAKPVKAKPNAGDKPRVDTKAKPDGKPNWRPKPVKAKEVRR